MELILSSIDFAENRSKEGYSSGGEIYFSIGEAFFPADLWYDCAFWDLKAWLPRILSFGSNHTDSCELFFMDGPYSVRLNRLQNGSICADFLRDHKVMGIEQNVDLHTLLTSALSCCRKYDRFLYERGKANLFQEEIRTLLSILNT